MRHRSTAGIALVAGFLATGSALGQVDATLGLAPAADSVQGGTAEQSRTAANAAGAFGLLSQDFLVGATQFHPRDGDNLDYTFIYYWTATTGAGTRQFEAQVNLPAGAVATTLECYYNDTNASSNGSVLFVRESYNYNTDTPSNSVIATVSSSGSGGYQKPFDSSINETIRYRDGDLRHIYTLVLNLPGSTTNVSFRACRFFWHRQISPAPATASFIDVPTSSPSFQVVEALKDSGITAGCTANQYCPDSPVTRAQMAAFLARMGGLHWPY